MSYRQEYAEGEAEDEGAIVTRGEEQVQVPFGFATVANTGLIDVFAPLVSEVR